MSSPLRVRIVSSAARAITEAAEWWRTNRAGTDTFITDFENSLKLIALHPAIGARARNVKLEGVRRVHLARVHYHLYYRVNKEQDIEVLALWHTSRGNDPDL